MAPGRQRLVQCRKARGYTQQALAARLHVARSTVARWECGHTEPLPYLRPRLAHLLHLSPGELDALLSSPRHLHPLPAAAEGQRDRT
jgi:transcriptional regulator with XRE-family HTH domain